MCITVFYNNNEIETVDELQNTFNKSVQDYLVEGYPVVDPECCLCCVDINRYLCDYKIENITCMDIKVTNKVK